MGNIFSQPSSSAEQINQKIAGILSKLPRSKKDLPLMVVDSAEREDGTFFMDVMMHEKDRIPVLDGLDILARTEIRHSVQRIELSAASAKLVKELCLGPEETARRKSYMEYLAEVKQHTGDIKELEKEVKLLGAQIGVEGSCQDEDERGRC